MSDCIDRKAVIDAVHAATYGFICGAEDGDEMTDADKLVLSINKAVCNAIKALPTEQPNLQPTCNKLATDCVERRAAVDAVANGLKNVFVEYQDVAEKLLSNVPSVQPEPTRTFIELVVEYPPPELCTYKEYRGKPYYSIKYIENGETYIGYGTYNPEVLSQYLKEYFIASVQPETEERTAESAQNVPKDELISKKAAIEAVNGLPDCPNGFSGTYDKAAIIGILEDVPSVQPEIIRCEECRWGREVCGNIECFVDSNIPPEYHGYEWFCPNGERRTDE